MSTRPYHFVLSAYIGMADADSLSNLQDSIKVTLKDTFASLFHYTQMAILSFPL